MKQSGYAAARDARIADETIAARDDMCPAKGCPNRWTVTGEKGRACGAHYFADPSEWPKITERLQAVATDRAREHSHHDATPAQPLTREEKRAILDRLSHVGRQSVPPRAWAEGLRFAHEQGAERLTRFQVDAYAAALKGSALRRASSEPLPPGVRP